MIDSYNNLNLLTSSQLLTLINSNPNFSDAKGVGETPAGGGPMPGLRGMTKAEADAIFDLYENQGGSMSGFALQIGPNGTLPLGLSSQARQDLTTILNDPGLATILEGGTGNRVTSSSLGSVFWEAAHAAVNADRWSDISGLSALTAQQNGAPLEALTDLAANWDTYGLHTNRFNWNNPPATLPPQLLADIRVVMKTPGLLALIEGSNGNVVTHAAVQNAANAMETDLFDATAAFDSYKSANADPDPAALEIARQATDLASYARIISTVNGGSGDGKLTQAELQFIADNPSGFPPNIVDAAKLFSSTRMFDAIASTGKDPATPSSFVFDVNAIGSWLASGAPVTSSDVQTLLTRDALDTATADVDPTRFGADLFINPSHYSGAQKTAVLLDLQQQLQKITAINTQFPDTGYQVDKTMKDPISVVKDLQNHISQLENDADVKTFESTAVPTALQAIVSGNGGLSAIFQDEATKFNDAGSAPGASTTLGTFITAAGGDIAKGVSDFVAQANFLNSALPPQQQAGGTNAVTGATTPAILAVDPKKIASNSAEYADVLSYFKTNVATGLDFQNDLTGARGNPDTDPLAAASATFMGEVGSFSAVLSGPDLSANMPQVMQSYNDIVFDNTFTGASTTDLMNILSWMAPANTTGEPDDASLIEVINRAEAQNPDAFLDDQGVVIPTSTILTGIKQVIDDVRGGAKISDSLDKLKLPNLGTPGLQNLYGLGVFHAVSAFMGGLALTAKATTVKGQATPEQITSMVASGMSMMGTIGEASTKYASKTAAFNIADFSKSQLKIIENSSKLFGSTGSAISGVLSILSGIDLLNSGDTFNGALNITSGSVSLAAAGASATDGALGLVAELGFTEDLGLTTAGMTTLSAGVAALAGVLSVGVAIIGLVGMIIGTMLAHEKEKRLAENDSDGVNTVLDRYGITGQGIPTPPPPAPGYDPGVDGPQSQRPSHTN